MLMMTLFNGRDREEDDWVQLLRQADPRYKFISATRPPVGTMGVMEVLWKDNEKP